MHVCLTPGNSHSRVGVVCRDSIVDVAGPEALVGFYLRPNAKPATSPTKPLTPAVTPQTDKPVVLYRDVNAWCPFCQKVWMVLLEKQIPFDTVLIDLGNKPEWYNQVAESMQTPAVLMNGKHMAESNDIMLVVFPCGCVFTYLHRHFVNSR